MMKGEIWRYSRRELDNVLSLTGLPPGFRPLPCFHPSLAFLFPVHSKASFLHSLCLALPCLDLPLRIHVPCTPGWVRV